MPVWDRTFRGYRVATAREHGGPYGLIEDGVVGVRDGVIAWVGQAVDANPALFGANLSEGEGRCLTPGLIDCHTHLIYGGQRVAEWEQRLKGVSYEEISRAGGGIASTVRATRSASEAALYAAARDRVERLLNEGVTTFEIKSGYGLDLASELKMLQVATDLRRSMPIDVSRTCLAAHCVSPEFRGREDDYVRYLCAEVLPAVRPYCEAVDAFCESIAFHWSHCATVFRAAQEFGLGCKIHAEQLSHTGAAAAAAKMGAWSADHLEYLQPEEASILAEHGTVAVLLPGAYYFLRQQRTPPIAALRAHGVPMAVASDSNPGSSPVQSLLLMMNMACTLFGLTPEEAFHGVTTAAARALRLDHRMGSIEIGKQADLVVWDIESPAELAYGIGINPCRQVFKRGELVIDHS